ncbi:PREDICTED: uncharacterized protein LOC104709596 [Camelina sativa]|uniref:Uncharacterized protein LOC104709596 n=1 Tax=Camelina sativa TaxID=90675 RepID=A0ABM0TD14_CAMSA|nr:PREDICTED: uncharacterized protein LOC104709596 [Camelina sativa]
MVIVLADADFGGDFDEEAHDRDEFHIDQLVNEFVDEPPVRHDVYPESDTDENGDGTEPVHTHIRRGDGHLYDKQTFFSGVAFKEAVTDYVLRTGNNLKQYRYDKDKIGFMCVGCNGDDGSRCEWKVYAAILPSDNMWRIRKFNDKHSCIPNGECEMFKVPHIARLFLDKIRDNPEYFMPMKMEEIIKERWKISVTRHQCQAARKKALIWIDKEYDEQFARLRDYAAEILESNKDSHVEVECVTDDGGKDMFNRFYVCFDNIRRTWKETCRPLIGMDGCFLKNKVKGQLLVALGKNANNGIYPIAWGVVKVENTDNWAKGIDQSCSAGIAKDGASNIYGNLKKHHGNKTRMKPLLWDLAWSYNETDYKRHLERIYCYDTGVYNDVMRTNPKSWCKAFHKIESYCEDVDNNPTESFNSSINKAREKPFIAMLETIRRLAMVRIARRSAESYSHTGICTPYVALFLAKEHKYACESKVYSSTNGTYEVHHGLDKHRVCLKKMVCSCMKWQICGIPCEHAYAVIIEKTLVAENYVCQWFRTAMWRRNYTEGLVPQRGPRFWPETNAPNVCIPDDEDQDKGTKKKPDKKRKKGANESSTKKKPKEKKRIMHCGISGEANHNSRFHKKEFAKSSQGEPSEGSLTQA